MALADVTNLNDPKGGRAEIRGPFFWRRPIFLVGPARDDMPHWMGGLLADAPPRRGRPECDEMMAKRAQEGFAPNRASRSESRT
jgi:hypothetical protein